MIVNHEAERIKSKATEADLRAAIDALDLQSIPPEKRWKAISFALARVMVSTVTDPRERSKDAFQQAKGTYERVTGVVLPDIV